MSDALYYRHSGRFTPAAVVITLLAGLVTAFIGGVLYGIIIFYMPLVYVNFLLTLGLSLGLGKVVGMVAMAQKIRSVPVVALLALLTGLCAEYAACVGWISAVTSFQAVILDPADLVLVLEALAETGVWSIRNSTPSGAFLIGIWIVEALIIIGGTVMVAYGEMARTPFCESCVCWLKDSATVGPFQPVRNPPQLKSGLEQGDFAELGNIAPLHPDDAVNQFAEYEVINCPNCDEMAVLTVRNVTLTIDKEGKVSRKDDNIIDRLLIDKACCDLIKELGPKPQETSPSAEGEQGSDPSEEPADDTVPPAVQ